MQQEAKTNKVEINKDDLLALIKSNYQESYDFLDTKKQSWVSTLRIWNNIDKSDDKISAGLLVSTFQQLLGMLYKDKMQAVFEPTSDTDFVKVRNLNKLAEYHHGEMNKLYYRYDSLWDGLFFNMGIIDMSDFDPVLKQIKPSCVNPLYFGYDPYFENEQDWRYYWKWITLSKTQLVKLQKAGKLLINDLSGISQGLEPRLWEWKIDIDKSKKGNSVPPSSNSKNGVYQILDMFLILEDGTRIRVWTDKNISQIIAIDADISQDAWDIVLKKPMRVPHQSINSSKVDLIEDKHRTYGALLNLINIKAKDWATPIYEYDRNTVVDKTAFLQRQVNQHIPVDRLGSVQPLQKDPPVDNSILSYFQMLESETEKAVGLPSSLMGRKKMSATESALRQQISETVSSVDVQLLMACEIEFWRSWKRIMDSKLKKGDKLRINIAHPDGTTITENLSTEDILIKAPVVVNIISSADKEYKDLVVRRDLMQLFPVLQQSLPPTAMKNFIKYFMFPKFTYDTKMLDLIYPKSSDEIKAEQENELLDINKIATIDPNDNDEEHMFVHYRAKDTPAKWAHIFAHEKQLADKKGRQQQQENQSQQGQPQEQGLLPTAGGRTNVPKDKRNPAETPVPLKAEMGREIFGAGKELR